MIRQFFFTSLLSLSAIWSIAQGNWQKKSSAIITRWYDVVNPDDVHSKYPRPQLVRNNWKNLNGLWNYAITLKDADWPAKFDGQILVPFPLESALSGVKKALRPEEILWYKTIIKKPATNKGDRILLNFGAVDFEAIVFINDKNIGSHKGGYQNFSFDITEQLNQSNNELVVKVWDPTDQGPNPHGKQVLSPQGIMYTPSSGIWQTVWMEIVPDNYVTGIKSIPDVDL
ncbi:MAG: glycoside hydrolase family 2, partial [Chitinophagaceae bacterium]|nr:glycoside hydrolase family 2 [Chitinophagaceae bacterium]